MNNLRVCRQTGIGRFFTLTFWRIQLGRLLNGQYPLCIVETFEAQVPDETQEGEQ